GIPETREARTPDQHARWLLAYLLDWHRREDKAAWWEYFRLRDLPEEDLFDEPQAIAGLEYAQRVLEVLHKTTGRATGSVVDRYRFPAQEMEVRDKAELKLLGGGKFGDVVAVDRAARTIDVKKGPSSADTHPSAVFALKYVNTD